MKTFATHRFLGGVLLTLLGAAGPLAYADERQVASGADAQRAVIEESRRTHTLRLDVLAKDCERKFAVTRCLDLVQTERLAIEGKLNRQETLLNDAQRQERGREQKERNREKAAAQAEKMANLASGSPVQAKQPKLASQPSAAASARQPAIGKESALSAPERSARVKDYQRKQADAIAKRAEVAKRLKDSGVKKHSLPTPE